MIPRKLIPNDVRYDCYLASASHLHGSKHDQRIRIVHCFKGRFPENLSTNGGNGGNSYQWERIAITFQKVEPPRFDLAELQEMWRRRDADRKYWNVTTPNEYRDMGLGILEEYPLTM